MALVDNLEQFVADNTLTGSWYKPNLRARCSEFIEDEGLVAPTGTISITENGTVDVTQYASASVEVSGGSSDFQPITVTFSVEGEEGDSQHLEFYLMDNNTGAVMGLCKDTDDYYTSFQTDEIVVGDPVQIELVRIGESTLIANLSDGAEPKSVSGSVTIFDDQGFSELRITGDCTIVANGIIPK